MPGLTRKCRAGGCFQIGPATVRILQTGRKAVINVEAPPEVSIDYTEPEAHASPGRRAEKDTGMIHRTGAPLPRH